MTFAELRLVYIWTRYNSNPPQFLSQRLLIIRYYHLKACKAYLTALGWYWLKRQLGKLLYNGKTPGPK